MDDIEQELANWKASLFSSISVGALHARNPIAHKWKALFRALVLRETVSWRLHDLMVQSYALHQQHCGLGARILLRSSFETVAVLIYLNQIMQQVLDGELNFHAFSEKTSVLLLGARNNADGLRSLNIVTILEKCDKRYPGLMALYADLSESAHPNFEGLCMGFSRVDREERETHFSNRWMELFGDRHLGAMELCMQTFIYEYNHVWLDLMGKLERWVEANDAELEATKDSDRPPTYTR